MHDILQYLKHSGEQLDSQIAAATGIALAQVRSSLVELAARGEVVVCHSIRYQDCKPREALLCRIAGFIPPAAPGRKAKAQ